MKKANRMLALLLAASIVCSLLPTTLAATSESESPVIIPQSIEAGSTYPSNAKIEENNLVSTADLGADFDAVQNIAKSATFEVSSASAKRPYMNEQFLNDGDILGSTSIAGKEYTIDGVQYTADQYACNRWATDKKKGEGEKQWQWAKLTWENAVQVNQIAVYQFQELPIRANAAVLESSSDGINWTQIATKDFEPAVLKMVIDLEQAVDTKYLRIKVGGDANKDLNIAEIEAYFIDASKDIHLTAGGATFNSLSFSWEGPTDGQCMGYNVYVDGNVVGTTQSMEYTVTELLPSTSYSLSVKAVDSDGNEYGVVAPIQMNTSQRWTSKLGVFRIYDTRVIMKWNAASGATGYDVFVNGERVTQTPIATCQYEITNLLANTKYSVTVKALENETVIEQDEVSFYTNKTVGYSLESAAGKPLKLPYSDMALSMEYSGPALSDPNYFYWCTSPIEDNNGKIHLFAVRWPVQYGMDWMRQGELVHFRADDPEGPYEQIGDVIIDNADLPKGQVAIHNVRVSKVSDEDGYVIMYITQTGSYQNIQMLRADSLDGEWRMVKGDKLIDGVADQLAPTTDLSKPHGTVLTRQPGTWTENSRRGVTNPDILKIGDEYIIYFKALVGDVSTYGYATSRSLEGPYTIAPNPLTDNKGHIEDADAFEWNGKYYLLTTDNEGTVSGGIAYGVLWESTDGKKFEAAEIAYGKMADYITIPPGSVDAYTASRKFERPALLFQDGEPTHFFGAGGTNITGGKGTCSYVLRITDNGAEVPPADSAPVLMGQTVNVGSGYSSLNPQNLVSAAGLGGDFSDIEKITHQITDSTVWHMNTAPGADAWIEIDLLQEIPLENMYLWNHNRIGSFLNRQSKDIEVSYSNDAQSWTKLGDYTVASVAGDGAAVKYSSKIAINQTARYVKIFVKNAYKEGKDFWALDKVLFTGEAPEGVAQISVSPLSVSVVKGRSETFRSTTTTYAPGAPTPEVTWSVSGAKSKDTTITDGVLYVGSDETASQFQVTASAGGKSGIAQVNVSFNLIGRRTEENTAKLTWDSVDGAASYAVYQNDTKIADGLTQTAYEAKNLTVGSAAYRYQVKALNAQAEEISVSRETRVAIVKENAIGDGSDLYMPAYKDKIKVPISDIALNLDFIGPATSDPAYHYWCTSVIYDDVDGKYHMFTSRVPSSVRFETGWSKVCEIAHMVSDTPEGPFQEVGVVFSSKDFEQYGLVNASPHNSRISMIDGKYCLLFMVQFPDTAEAKNPDSTCLATAEDINGPWTLQDNGTNTGVILQGGVNGAPAPINNADILKVGDQYHIYFKAHKNGFVQFFVAISDKLEGPYTIQPNPVTNSKTGTEDLEAFEWNGKYYLLADDNHGGVTGVNAAGILFESRDGLNFRVSDALMGFADMDEYIELPAGTMQAYGFAPPHNEYGKHERPGLLMIDGEPAYFYAPSGANIDGFHATQNYVYKIKTLPEYDVAIAPGILNGAVTTDIDKAKQTQDVVITATPETGYKLKSDSLKVLNQDKKEVAVTADGRFSMPRGGVTITAEFVDGRQEPDDLRTYRMTLSSEGVTKSGDWVVSGLAGSAADATSVFSATAGDYIQFQPEAMEAGWYEVAFWNIISNQDTMKMTATVHANGEDATVQPAARTEAGWNTVGGFYFNGSGDEYLKLTVTTAGNFSRVADVRFLETEGDTVTGVAIDTPQTVVYRGEKTQFKATVTGNGSYSKEVNWSVEGAQVEGTHIDENGILMVAATESAKTLTIKAASAEDSTLVGEATVAVSLTAKPDNYMKLWYDEPANNWKTQALPIGNGNLGGMVFGKTDTERVQINEITLWAGGPGLNNLDAGYVYNGSNKDNTVLLPQIQAAFLRGDLAEGKKLSEQLLGNNTGKNGYQDLGSFYMDFAGAAKTTTPSNYRRELDLNDGVARVSYTNAGVDFTREHFASNPGNVMVTRLTASEKDALGFTLKLIPNISNDVYLDNSKAFTTTAKDGVISCLGEVKSSQMKFAVQLKVVAPDATVTNNADGTLTVGNGEDVLIFMTAGTNYDISEAENVKEMNSFLTPSCDYLDDNDPTGSVAMSEVAARIDEASKQSYQDLLNIHQADYSELYGRAALDLGDKEYADFTTDELLRKYNGGERNQYLETLLFQYGRYMLISSSRDSLPANLQGVWNDSNQPGWTGDYHLNINLQMNYWPAFVTNIAEVGDPLVTFIDSLRVPGNLTARKQFGVENGWVANNAVNVFGMTGVRNGFNWAWAPGSAAWICNNLWDYYQFTQDPEVLERIYPIMKEAAEFWQGFLIEDPATGELTTIPSASPEHGPISMGTTYDMSLAKMLMQDVIQASEILGCDADFRQELKALCAKMEPLKIGASGQLKEWREEHEYNKDINGNTLGEGGGGHRHMSQLMALHPGNMITQETPKLMEAAIRTLELRGDGGTDGTGGWSMAQKANLWARTGNGDKALYYLRLLFNGGIYSNLFDQVGGYFQIDGNLGATAGIAEMLIQSHAGYIQPLAALPGDWADGSYRGLVARGNFETDAEWSDGNLTNFAIRSGSGGTCTVRYPGIAGVTLESGGVRVAYDVLDNNTIAFETVKGAEYLLAEFTTTLPAPTGLQANRYNANSVSLRWDAVAGAESYRVYRQTESGEYVHVAASVADTTFTDLTAVQLSTGDVYTYQVAAVSEDGVDGKRTAAVTELVKDASFVDDHNPAVTYVGEGWKTSVSATGSYDNTQHYTQTQTDYCELTFTGTGIEFYTSKQDNADFIDVYLDGVRVADDVALYANPKENKVCVYRVDDLEYGEHTIKLLKEDTGTQWAVVDYFRILGGSADAVVDVSEIEVASHNGVTLLTDPEGSLQMVAKVLPLEARDISVSWSVTNESGEATSLASIDENGLLSAGTPGKGAVKVTATANDSSGAQGTLVIQVKTAASTPGVRENVLRDQSVTLTEGTLYSDPKVTASRLTDGYFCADGQKDRTMDRLILAQGLQKGVVEIALSEASEIDEVVIYERWSKLWNPAYIDEMKISAFVDGKWQEIGTSDASDPTTLNDYVKKHTIAVTSPQTTKIRIEFATKTPDVCLTLWEVEAYGPTDDSVTTDKKALLAQLDEAAELVEADFKTDWAAFVTARDAAIAVANDSKATQEQVAAAAQALDAAIGDVTANKQLVSITAKAFSLTVPAGRSVRLNVLATYDRGVPVQTMEGVSFATESGTQNIVSIDEEGNVTGIAAGTETVLVTMTESGVTRETRQLFTVVADDSAKINITADSGGTIVRSEEPPYTALQKLTLTAQPDAEYMFAGWTVDGKRFDRNPLTVTVGQTAAVHANFSKDEEVEPDKTAIDTALAAAEAAKAGVIVSEDAPDSVANGTKFVSTAAMNALDAAIDTATAAKDTVKTAAEVTAAAEALDAAVKAFKAAIKTGTYMAPYNPPSNTTTKTEKNPDGSTTKTVTDKKTGNVTETTTYPDGTKIVATTPKDGKTSIEVSIPKGKDSVTVTIPADKQPSPGEVAVIVHEDGTREVVKTSVSTKDGLRVTLTGNAKLEIIDNSKSFADVAGSHWAAAAVQFAASRELFNGTGKESFSPASDMSRAMLVTVLARLDGQDTSKGDTWDAVGVAWAKENGISDGTDVEDAISREQLAVMLYRYAKAEKLDADLKDFSDASNVSAWAAEAMNWAVKSGIITGKGGALDPQGNASRAEVATMLERFVSQLVK